MKEGGPFGETPLYLLTLEVIGLDYVRILIFDSGRTRM